VDLKDCTKQHNRKSVADIITTLLEIITVYCIVIIGRQ